jgi:hypothetical protein
MVSDLNSVVTVSGGRLPACARVFAGKSSMDATANPTMQLVIPFIRHSQGTCDPTRVRVNPRLRYTLPTSILCASCQNSSNPPIPGR